MVGEIETSVGRLVEPELPEDYLCARCGYPSGRSGSAVCPECGWEATAEDLEARAARLEVVQRWDSESAWVERWVVIALVYSIGAAVVSKSLVVGIGAAFALAIGIPASVWIGGLWLGRLHPERREFTRVAWQRCLWVLHLPWLVAPAFVAVAMFVGLIDRWAGAQPGSEAYGVVVFAGFALWCVGVFGSFVGWWVLRMGQFEGPDHPGLGWTDLWAFLAGAVVLAGASGLGIGAGVVSAFGVADWMNLSVMVEG